MDVIRFLRSMHADARTQLKSILASDDAAEAEQMWQRLQPILDLHEELEDTFVYTPLASEMGPDTPLGDWPRRHDGEVAMIKELIDVANAAEVASPSWRMAIGRVADALSHHVLGEEGQIFGRIEQAWPAERLESVGAQMQTALAEQGGRRGTTARRQTKQSPAASASSKRR